VKSNPRTEHEADQEARQLSHHPRYSNTLRRQTATINEWPPKKFLKSSAADRLLRCKVMFWLFFVLVLVLDRSSEQLYHSILVNALLGREFVNGYDNED
jgi:hypothetical protein